MAGKSSPPKKSTSSKTASSAKKSSLKVKDLAPKKDPKGGSTAHSPKSGGRNDY